MFLKTPRMLLVPLSWKELELLLDEPIKFSSATGMMYHGERIEGAIRRVYADALRVLRRDSSLKEFYQVWVLLLPSTSTIIGSILIKGLPDEHDLVEIGYGLHSDYFGKGLMTEAVEVFCRHIRTIRGVKGIIAETNKTNIASQRVLEKNRFYVERKTKTAYWYRQLE